jgi:hypothetical protein
MSLQNFSDLLHAHGMRKGWDEIIRGWRKMRNEELHNLSCAPNIIRMMKLRKMRWAGQVAGMFTGFLGLKVRMKETTRKTDT